MKTGLDEVCQDPSKRALRFNDFLIVRGLAFLLVVLPKQVWV